MVKLLFTMKNFAKLTFVLALIASSAVLNAQKADTTLFKAKIASYQTKVKNGKILTIAGVSGVGIGVVCFAIGSHYSKEADKYDMDSSEWDSNVNRALTYNLIGLAVGAAGLGSFIPGVINLGIGKRKINEYQIRLDDARTGFYYSPHSVGVTLALKF